MEETAYGPLNLTPDEFGRLTPREFILQVEGYELRARKDLERIAWQTMILVNIQLPRDKKIKNIEELIGKYRKSSEKQKNKADYESDLKNILERTDNGINRK